MTIKNMAKRNFVHCKFILAYIGDCGELADKTGFCDKHKDLKCRGCGKQATKQCDSGTSLVCGAPLCDNCSHSFLGQHGKQPKD